MLYCIMLAKLQLVSICSLTCRIVTMSDLMSDNKTNTPEINGPETDAVHADKAVYKGSDPTYRPTGKIL